MILEILIFVFTTIFIYYLYAYKSLHGYFKQRGIKFLPGVPLFGNIIGSTFKKKHLLDELTEVYDAFPEDKYVVFFEFTRPIILIRDPDLIKTVTVKDFDCFTDHKDYLNEESDPLFAGSLFLMKGKKWHDMRTTLSPAFTASKMKYMLPLITQIATNIVDFLNDHQNHDVDVDDLIHRYTNDVIASAGFGLEVNSVKDRNNEFYKIGSHVADFNFRLMLITVLKTQCPTLEKLLGLRLFPDNVYNFFTNIVTATMDFRKKEKLERPDMIQLLMEAEKGWTPADITGQVFIFFTAGFETTAAVLIMTIHELALNLKIQEKLYQECKKFQEEHELSFDNMSELKYLDCVINETLRKWSPGIILDRTCTKPYEFPPPREGGQPYVIKPGDAIYNVNNQIQMNAKYWPEPHKYDPERFSEENKGYIKPFTFLPFGVGPRVCIGMRFAMMELKVLMHYTILNFKIVKTAKTQDPIKMMPLTFNIRAAGGTYVQFEKLLTE